MAKRFDNHDNGPSQRQLRVGELIRRALAEILMRGDIHDPDLAHVSVTVGEVQPSPDLRQAIVHVTPLGGQNAKPVIAALNRNAGELRHQINRSVTLKFSPKLKFVLDRTFDNLDEARRIFDDETVQRDIAKDD